MVWLEDIVARQWGRPLLAIRCLHDPMWCRWRTLPIF